MNAQRLQQVEEIFLEAAACEGEAREALLAARCAGDDALRREVEALLAHDDGGDHDQVLSAPLLAPALLPRNLVETGEGVIRAGTRIGAYTITGLLGIGGMGAVYVAQQESPRRTVALKVLRPGAASPAVLRRMDLEAELLGRLKHPGIAQIFEAGRADYGVGPQPFFAMELVEGPTLTQYAANHNLSVRDRLALMLKVCEAIEHAHQRGVIHRDLKPANILVDASGQPKILDFGVARPVDADLRVTTMRTGVGALIGTLPYMSPEQVGDDPSNVDTRADVYALGVVMYELLAGRLPYDLSGRALPDAARIIREEPARPLSAVDRALRGDVEIMVSRAMDKDRTRRYQSAAALAEDIRRFLAGEPIEARRDSALYVLRKHLRRYHTAAAIVSIAVIGLSLFSLYASRQAEASRLLATTEREARERADLFREQAERQAERLRRSVYFNRIGFAQAALAAADSERMIRLLQECPEDLRGWEWRYLKRLSDQSTDTLVTRNTRHGGVALSTAGRRIASWPAQGAIQVWDAASRRAIAEIQPASPTAAAALDAAGERCAVACIDGTIELWQVGQTAPLWRRHIVRNAPIACEFSPDGRYVAVGGDYSMVVLVDTATSALFRRLPTDNHRVHSIAISPDGKWAAFGLENGEVRVHALPSGERIARFAAHRSAVRAVAFSDDSWQLASCSNDRTIRMWHVQGNTFTGGNWYRIHDNKVTALAFHPGGKLVASGGTEAVVRILRPATADTERSLFGHIHTVERLAYADEGRTLVSASHDGVVKWWDLASIRGDPAVTGPAPLFAAAVSPDGRALYAAGELAPIQCRDLTRLAPVPGFDGPARAVRALTASPDGGLLASVGTGPEIEILDAHTGARIRTIAGHDGAVSTAAFLPDGRLVSAAADGVRAWNPRTGEAIWFTPLPGPDAPTLSVDRAGRRLAVAAGPSIVILSADDGSIQTRLDATGASPRACCIFADGQRLATGGADGEIRIWDIASGRVVLTLTGHRAEVLDLCVLPDQTRIVSGSLDNTIRLWDTTDGEEVLLLRHHLGGVSRVLATPDGSSIISCGDDGSIRVWQSSDPAAP